MSKILHRFQLGLICIIVFLVTALPDYAQQDTLLNKYALRVITDWQHFQNTIQTDPSKAMTDIKKKIPRILLDIRYADTNNFMHQQLYPPVSSTFLRAAAADSLAIVQIELIKMGLGLKIFDAYRPYSVTQKMWEAVKDERYAADPKKGSGHNRGIAVDLTIINLLTNEELNMGTGFDNFSDTAHHAFTNLPEEVLLNRLLLKSTMQKHGFRSLDTEWWHYSLPNAKDFELLDIQFGDLKMKN